MSKPQIVLVPGAWHSPQHFSTLITALEAHGYTVHSLQLPSVGSASPPTDLSQDVAALRRVLDTAIGASNDVVVICHSWGGVVTGSALVGYSKEEREKGGKEGGVVRCGYIAAFMADEGASLTDIVGEEDPWWYERKPPLIFCRDPAQIFYHDISASDQEHYISLLQTQSMLTIDAKATGAAWKVIPTSYLICEEDKAIPAGGQEAVIRAAEDVGAKEIVVTRVDASHSPFLSKLDETVEWVRGVAGEKL